MVEIPLVGGLISAMHMFTVRWGYLPPKKTSANCVVLGDIFLAFLHVYLPIHIATVNELCKRVGISYAERQRI